MSDSGDIPVVLGAFSKTSAKPTPRRRKRPKRRRKAEGKIRERIFLAAADLRRARALVRAAGDAPLGVYIRSKLFDQPLPEYHPRRPRHPAKDQQALGQLLGELGKARLANNLNQLAKAANTGSLPVTPETEKALVEACAEIAGMRKLLMQGLGFSADGSPL